MRTGTIVASTLVKRFGATTAVDGVSFEVAAGEIFGFLGPNGAGKSTTISMLTTLTLPTSGTATVGGYDVVHQAGMVRASAGVALQEIGLDPVMTANELLLIQARLFGLSARQARSRAAELLRLVKLEVVGARRIATYSGGMKRRLDLALALVHEPTILFLDEPTTGLDPASRRDVWNEIRRLNREQGMTIFLTTQYLEEADELADRIAIINRGVIAVEGTPEALKAQIGGESINVTFADDATVAQAQIELTPLADHTQIDRQTLRLYLTHAAEAVPTVVSRLEAQGLRAQSLTLSRPTLDDVFLSVTGQRYENEPAPSPTLPTLPTRSRAAR